MKSTGIPRRFWIIALLGLLLPSPGSGATNPTPRFRSMLETTIEKSPPSVFLILADGLGYGDLGCYGQTEIRTPNIDRLAAEGMRFTDYYAGSPSAIASRCALLTGFHSGHASLRGDDGHPLPAEEKTLAHLLTPARYQTAWLGSWGLGMAGTSGEPLRQGFEEVRALLDLRAAGNQFPAKLYRNGEEWNLALNEGGKQGQYFPDLLLLMGTNFLRTAQYRPFLLVYAPSIPQANPEPTATPGKGAPMGSEGEYASKTWPAADKRRAALISRLDRDVGVLMASLQATKMFQNTLVFLTSDGGPHPASGQKPSALNSTGLFRGARGELLEGGLRVPMIAWAPKRIPAGRVSDEVWAAWDFLPTIAELTQMPKPKLTDGVSMARSVAGLTQTNHHDFLYWETHVPHTAQAIRAGPWKGIRRELGKPLELYHLKEDPAERHDVAAAHPEIIAKLEAYLKTARTENPKWPLKYPGGTNSVSSAPAR